MAKYPSLGSMIARRDQNTGASVLDVNGKQQYYIKVDKNVDIKVNGHKVEGYINISRPRDKFDRMLEKGSITPKEHAEKISRFEKGGDLDYIQFEVSVKVEG